MDELLRKELEELLQRVRNAKRIYRDQGADEILRRPELLQFLVQTAFEPENDQSVKAAWILELVCLYEVRLLVPYTRAFTEKLSILSDESSIRPISKVCSLLTRLYLLEPWEPFEASAPWINNILTASFEWLTADHKVAAKVFAMETLYFWGLKFDWIHGDLNALLDRQYADGSAAFRSRARKIMDKISGRKE